MTVAVVIASAVRTAGAALADGANVAARNAVAMRPTADAEVNSSIIMDTAAVAIVIITAIMVAVEAAASGALTTLSHAHAAGSTARHAMADRAAMVTGTA